MSDPQVRCEACGARCEAGAPVCPTCGAPIRHEHAHRVARRQPRTFSRPVRDDCEDEVRETLYGWRSGGVELRRGS